MAARLANEQTRAGTPPALMTGHLVNGRVRSVRASYNLATVGGALAQNDTLALGKRPKGSRYCGHRITAGVTFGATATLAIGIAGSTGKYRAAAVHTAVDTPTDVAIAARLADDPLTADEDMILTIAAAAAPTSDHWLVIETFYTYD